MTFVVTSRCIGSRDTACMAVCPVDCIHPLPDALDFEYEEMSFIDPAVCIDCGLCVDVCPVQAIFAVDDLPAEFQAFVQLNEAYFARKRP